MTLPVFGAFASRFGTASRSQVSEIATELEALGYGTLWMSEFNGRDIFVDLALILEATTTLRCGTGIANIWARDALAMKCAAMAVAEAFPDRFSLGLGISHQPLVDGPRGHAYGKPFETLSNYLDAFDRAVYTGVEPSRPFPRLLGALGPRMLGLAQDRTDGVVPYNTTVDHTAGARQAVGDKLLCPIVAVVIDSDRARARQRAREQHVAFYMGLPNYTNNYLRMGFEPKDLLDGGSDRLVDALVAHGTVDQVASRLQEFLDAGADHVGVNVIRSQGGPPIEDLRELAPALKELKRVDRRAT
jgi:probable F420-dependent oxidoreductase